MSTSPRSLVPALGLGGLATLSDVETRSISAENPTGERGGGARSVPDKWNAASQLGPGWKARPAIGLEPGEETVLANVAGPGVIQHIWITVDVAAYHGATLRFYWDDAIEPAVECPLGDFFANGHGRRYRVDSVPVSVNPSGGFNCFWPMPFARRARITVQSHLDHKLWGFFYQITYALGAVGDDVGRFHARFHRSVTPIEHPEHVVLDHADGPGHYVGTFLAWTQHSEGWWGEGEMKFYLDDDDVYPTICGTGVEDYVGGAWGFGDETYSAPYMGYPLRFVAPKATPLHALYRWHVLDPIRFRRRLRVTVQALGVGAGGKYQFRNDGIASVAYWYAQPSR